MAARLTYNDLRAELGASLTNSATAVTFTAPLSYKNGTAVPTIAGGDYIPLSLMTTAGVLTEIVYLTAYTTGATTGTITRAREGTSGVAHSIGEFVVCAPTVEDIAGDTWLTMPWATNWSTVGSSWGHYHRVGNRCFVDAYGIRASSSMASGGTVATLASGYRPKSLSVNRECLINNGGTVSMAIATVATTGVVTISTSGAVVVPVGAAVILAFDFPLD